MCVRWIGGVMVQKGEAHDFELLGTFLVVYRGVRSGSSPRSLMDHAN